VIGVKLDVKPEAKSLTFNVKARLEEKARRSQKLIVEFTLAIETRPALAKFEVSGIANIVGKDDEIGRMLEVDPETNVPQVFHSIYQYAFLAVYLLSTVLNVPSPPSNLLGSETPVSALPPEETAETAVATEAVEAASDEATSEMEEAPQPQEQAQPEAGLET